MPEDSEVMAQLSSEDGAAASEMGAGDNVVRGGRHPWMQRQTQDYVLSKRSNVLMDNEKNDVLLKAGDVVQQTNHAWANEGLNLVLLCLFLYAVTSSGEGKGISAQWQK